MVTPADVDTVINAMSPEQLDVFVQEILVDADMVQLALERSFRVMVEFLNRHGLEDQLVGEIDPNEMVALIVTATFQADKEAQDG